MLHLESSDGANVRKRLGRCFIGCRKQFVGLAAEAGHENSLFPDTNERTSEPSLSLALSFTFLYQFLSPLQVSRNKRTDLKAISFARSLFPLSLSFPYSCTLKTAAVQATI
jgi:hypothetical protein